MSGRVLMIQGTMSSVGKSLLVAALCRIFAQDGYRVAPFKAQNMALNSFVTHDGLEIGRAQAMQAAAAQIDVTVEMNPILLKPEADSQSQVIVLGKPWARLRAREYYARKPDLWKIVTDALDHLRNAYDLIIIEGAGSAAELNLKHGDIVNMRVAHYANAPVLLVGDIDRGGIFAQLLGTLMLLEPHEQALVRGLVVNKFRGDRHLFHEGVTLLEERSGRPVLGVLPYLHEVGLPDEDSVALDEQPAPTAPHSPTSLTITVVRLPHISNFDDFDALRAESSVSLHFAQHPSQLQQSDLIILPGSKTTIADLLWLRQCGLADAILAHAHNGIPILGICGGYQMLGLAIHDPHAAESDVPTTSGLGLLPVTTYFDSQKQTVRATGTIAATHGLFGHAAGAPCHGYEIHMGRTIPEDETAPLLHITQRGHNSLCATDGAISSDGNVAGTYLHGLLDSDQVRHALLNTIAARKGVSLAHTTIFNREWAYDRLAASVREHLNMEYLQRMIMIEPCKGPSLT